VVRSSVPPLTKRTSLQCIACLVDQLCEALSQDDIDAFGEILHAGWLEKRKFATGISNGRIDECMSGPGLMGPLAADYWVRGAVAFCCLTQTRLIIRVFAGLCRNCGRFLFTSVPKAARSSMSKRMGIGNVSKIL
jgi:galactokinase/mevalonate kinase-like predicted kinase